MNLYHVLITRFNLKNPPLDWLEKRIILFENFTLPSVLNQSDKNFSWLLLCDPHSPRLLLDKLKQWKLQPTFVNHETENIASHVFIPPNITHVLSSRLDNDDAIHPNFIHIMKKNIEEKNTLLLDPINGYQLDAKTNQLYSITKYSGPFISYLEKLIPNQKPKLVYHFPGGHSKAASQCLTKRITSPKLWLQIVHDSNIKNTIQNPDKKISRNILDTWNLKVR